MRSDIADPRLGEVNRRIPYTPVLAAVPDAVAHSVHRGSLGEDHWETGMPYSNSRKGSSKGVWLGDGSM